MMAPHLTVIIPTWNENNQLPRLLAELRQQVGILLEIIIADARSQDGTQESARTAKVQVIQTPRGRGIQMNQAAALATSHHLLFLHADSTLNDPTQLQQALQAIQTCQARLNHPCAGHFKLHFDNSPDRSSWIWHYYEQKSCLNRPECINGDQGLLLSRDFFNALGGFAEDLPFLEDQQLAPRIAKQGHWITLPGTLTTSTRRFNQEGVMRRILLNALIMICFHSHFSAFLQQAPSLYRHQNQTAPLQLSPFFTKLQSLNQQADIKTRWHRWLKVGRYLRQSLWQLFFMLDLLLFPTQQPPNTPCLTFHDRFVHPFTNCIFFDIVSMILSWIGFHLFRLWFAFQERNHE